MLLLQEILIMGQKVLLLLHFGDALESGRTLSSIFQMTKPKGFSILKGITVLVYNLYYYYTLLDYTD